MAKSPLVEGAAEHLSNTNYQNHLSYLPSAFYTAFSISNQLKSIICSLKAHNDQVLDEK